LLEVDGTIEAANLNDQNSTNFFDGSGSDAQTLTSIGADGNLNFTAIDGAGLVNEGNDIDVTSNSNNAEVSLENTIDIQQATFSPFIHSSDDAFIRAENSSSQSDLILQVNDDDDDEIIHRFDHYTKGQRDVLTLRYEKAWFAGGTNIGIGTGSPSTNLDVDGNIRIRGGGPSEGDVLTATDGNGNATWTSTRGVPFYIRGTGLNNTGNRILRINGNTIYNASGRGLRLTVLNRNNYNVKSDQTYDTYGTTSDVNDLANALDNVGSNEIAVLTSYDAWEDDVNSNLDDAFQSLGLYNAMMTRNNGSRRPYAAIFTGSDNGGVNSAKVMEVEYSDDGSQPYAELSGTLINGTISGAHSIPSGLATPTGSYALGVDENGNVGIGMKNPSYKLHVNGRLKTNGINETSDRRLKRGIKTVDNAIGRVMQLRGVQYQWDQARFPKRNFAEGQQYGLIAQEVEKVLPELVHEDKQGYKSLEYTQLTGVLVEAMKDQQQRINQLERKLQRKTARHQAETQQLKQRVRKLEAAVDQMQGQARR
jgi:hypothetical protein